MRAELKMLRHRFTMRPAARSKTDAVDPNTATLPEKACAVCRIHV